MKHFVKTSVYCVTAFSIASSCARADQTFTLSDYLHHTWQNELVTYQVEKKNVPNRAALIGPGSTPVAFQTAPLKNGKVAVSFVVAELPADGKISYTLKSGKGRSTPGGSSLVKKESDALMLDGQTIAARVPMAGARKFALALPISQVTPPLLAVRNADGRWLGRGRLAGSTPVSAMKTTVLASGPVFAETRIEYTLAAGTYAMNVRVVKNSDAVLVDEEFNTDESAINNAYFQFSLREGLDASRVAVKGNLVDPHPERVETAAGLDFPLRFDADRRELSVVGYLPWWQNTTRVTTFHGNQNNDTLSFFPRHIGAWRNPMGNYLETRKNGEVFWSLPIYVDQEWTRDGVDRKSPYYTGKLEANWPATASRRKWAFFLSTTEKAIPKTGRSSVADAVVRYSDLPLDKVKDWVLDWNWRGAKYPRLYVKAEELDTIRKRAASDPAWTQGANAPTTFGLRYLLGGDPQVGQQLLNYQNEADKWRDSWGALPALRDFASNIFNNWGYTGFPAPNNARPMTELVRYDAAMAVAEATDAQKTEMSRLAAFVANVVYDHDWNPVQAGAHLGNVNMPPRQEHHLAVASVALPTHPLAAKWRARGIAEQERQINVMVRASGVWRENPHYQWEAAMYPLFQAAVPLKLSGSYDLFANPKVKKTWDYLLGILTPPSPRFTANGQADGKRLRVLPAFGNGSWEFMTLTGWLGAMTRDTDPAFSKRMMWAWNEQGRPVYSEMSQLIIDPNLPSQQPNLKSTDYEGFGSTLRAGFPSDDETWMAFRHGASVEHYSYGDQGSFMLYAKGSPLVLHFGSIYQPAYQGAWFFNRANLNHRAVTAADNLAPEYTAKPGDFEAGTELEAEDGSNDEVMHPKAYVSLSGADYARGEQIQKWQGVIGKDPSIGRPLNSYLPKLDIPDHSWNRRVLFLKDADPAAPNYFLLRDDFNALASAGLATLATEWNIWTLSQSIDTTSNPAKVKGKYGVDLDVYMAEPNAPKWMTRQESHQYLPSPSERFLVEKPWKETLTNLRAWSTPGAASGANFLAVLYPRKSGEAAPTFQTLAEGKGVRVITPRGTDWAFLSGAPVEWSGEGMSFSGTAGAIRKVGNDYQVIFTEPGRATVAGQTIVAEKPMEKMVMGNAGA